MYKTKTIFGIAFGLLTVFFSVGAQAAPDCDDIEAEFDRRLLVGGHPEQNVAIARQVRDSLGQMCGFADDQARTDMFNSAASFLPLADDTTPGPQTREEREAERQRQRDEANARREQKNAEKARRAKIAELPEHPLLKRPPTLIFRDSGFLPRSDGKYGLKVWDVELRDNELHLLYSTFPSREQYSSGDQAIRVYVSRLSTGGATEQFILESPSGAIGSAGFRRGRDEVLIQTQPGADKRAELQRWSAAGGGLLSSVPAPDMPWAGRGVPAFSHPTVDGALFYVGSSKQRSEASLIHWSRVSADGTVLATGTLKSSARADIQYVGTVRPHQGPAAIVVSYTMQDDQGVDSHPAVAPQITVGEHVIKGIVGAEQRLLVLAEEGGTLWESGALTRSLAWPGISNIPPDDYVRLGSALTQEMQIADLEYGSTMSLRSVTGVGNSRQSMITALGDGYGVLLQNSFSNPEYPPVRGSWLREVFASAPTRDTYLHPYAKQLGSEFSMVSKAGDNEVVLVSNDALLLLNARREPAAYARLPADKPKSIAIAADADGAWLLGSGNNAEGQLAIWYGRVGF